MKKRIAFVFYRWRFDNFYLIPSISLHNYVNQFCIWFQFLGVHVEIIFVKKGWEVTEE